MQAGETGINAVRIYSPIKPGYDQDPTGKFTRRWVPELAHVDGKQLQEPWTCETPPADYPRPIVDYRVKTAEAKKKIYALRRTDAARAEAAEVFQKHGSCKPHGVRMQTAKRDGADA